MQGLQPVWRKARCRRWQYLNVVLVDPLKAGYPVAEGAAWVDLQQRAPGVRSAPSDPLRRVTKADYACRCQRLLASPILYILTCNIKTSRCILRS